MDKQALRELLNRETESYHYRVSWEIEELKGSKRKIQCGAPLPPPPKNEREEWWKNHIAELEAGTYRPLTEDDYQVAPWLQRAMLRKPQHTPASSNSIRLNDYPF